jgi:hypothetical protein
MIEPCRYSMIDRLRAHGRDVRVRKRRMIKSVPIYTANDDLIHAITTDSIFRCEVARPDLQAFIADCMSRNCIQCDGVRTAKHEPHGTNLERNPRSLGDSRQVEKRYIRRDGAVDVRNGSTERSWVPREEIMDKLLSQANYAAEHVLDRSANAYADMRAATGGIHHEICVEIRVCHQIFSRVDQSASDLTGATCDKIQYLRSGPFGDIQHPGRLIYGLAVSPGARYVVPETNGRTTIEEGVDDRFRYHRMCCEAGFGGSGSRATHIDLDQNTVAPLDQRRESGGHVVKDMA